MNKKYLYKTFCLLSVLTVHQADAAMLLNPGGPSYNTLDYCPSCFGVTNLDVFIFDNAPIVLNFDPMYAILEQIEINLFNSTGVSWSSLTIEYTNSMAPFDQYDVTNLGLNVLATGSSTPFVNVMTDPIYGNPTGLDVSFSPYESQFVYIDGSADRGSMFDPNQAYSITISTQAVPVPAAVWLFGSGLIGLIGVARRKKI